MTWRQITLFYRAAETRSAERFRAETLTAAMWRLAPGPKGD